MYLNDCNPPNCLYFFMFVVWSKMVENMEQLLMFSRQTGLLLDSFAAGLMQSVNLVMRISPSKCCPWHIEPLDWLVRRHQAFIPFQEISTLSMHDWFAICAVWQVASDRHLWLHMDEVGVERWWAGSAEIIAAENRLAVILPTGYFIVCSPWELMSLFSFEVWCTFLIW